MSHWKEPNGSTNTVLRLNNSLTRTITPFNPVKPGHVGWYICGPTVYDSAHVGHARAYVTFDIMRRVLEDYLGLSVTYIMNVTDIDDKIILRARRNHLLSDYLEKSSNEVVAKLIAEKVTPHIESKLAKIANDDPKKTLLAENLATVKSDRAFAEKLEASKDYIAEILDAEHGENITDQAIFNALARRFEKEFFEDMKNLGVRMPTAITRVSEYVPDIVAYVEQIIKNGFAYESNGSVYFDTNAYMKSNTYAKLAPEHVSNEALFEEGEGALSGNKEGEKRSKRDFALWKKSKRGEPFWDSPWGQGRPGWHIECSAMASDLLPAPIDIHSGGVDLKFPHHDNEIAQAEAHDMIPQWINYFLHAGHVSIQGLKMSKSLKNFITIRTLLETYPPRVVRMLFLLHSWDGPMEYSLETIRAAEEREAKFREFFHLVREHIARYKLESTKPSSAEKQLQLLLQKTQQEVHGFILENMDFPRIMHALSNLVSESNAFIAREYNKGATMSSHVIRNVAVYITKMLRVFGVIGNTSERDTEYGYDIASGSDSNQQFLSALDVLGNFREQIRKLAKSQATPGQILELCDQLRDDMLPPLGVRLEDKPEGTSIKIEDAATLMQEIARAKAEKEELRLKKEKAKAEAEALARERELMKLRAKIPVEELFKAENDTRNWKSFDETGFPTADAEGKPLSDDVVKQLMNERKQHENLRKKLDKKK